jgi:hypothetical protein
MYAPADNLLLLEGVWMVVFPGDPSSDMYEMPFSENNTTKVVLHRIITLSTAEQSDGGKTFSLTVSDYVQDNVRMSTILYVLFTLSHTSVSMMTCSLFISCVIPNMPQ